MTKLGSDVLNITTERAPVLSTPAAQREQLVLTLLNRVTPLIKKFAHDWHLEYEDLYQDATLIIMEMLDKDQINFSKNPQAIASIRVRCRLLSKAHYTQRRQAMSLDELMLDDTLPSPYSHDPLSVLLTKERLEQLASTIKLCKGPHGAAIRSRYETAVQAVQV